VEPVATPVDALRVSQVELDLRGPKIRVERKGHSGSRGATDRTGSIVTVR
jgi:hypothetical protein